MQAKKELETVKDSLLLEPANDVEREARAFAEDLIRQRQTVLAAVETQEAAFTEVEGH